MSLINRNYINSKCAFISKKVLFSTSSFKLKIINYYEVVRFLLDILNRS